MDRPRQRACSGVEDEGAWLVGVDELSRGDGIGRVGDDGRERVAELRAYLLEAVAVAGDAHDVCAGVREGGGNGAAETPARAGDDCGGGGKILGGHP